MVQYMSEFSLLSATPINIVIWHYFIYPDMSNLVDTVNVTIASCIHHVFESHAVSSSNWWLQTRTGTTTYLKGCYIDSNLTYIKHLLVSNHWTLLYVDFIKRPLNKISCSSHKSGGEKYSRNYSWFLWLFVICVADDTFITVL